MIAILVMLSIILTASVLFPEIDETQIVAVLVGGSVLAAATAFGVKIFDRLARLSRSRGGPCPAAHRPACAGQCLNDLGRRARTAYFASPSAFIAACVAGRAPTRSMKAGMAGHLAKSMLCILVQRKMVKR